MLYITTRDHSDAYTAHRVLVDNRAADGGMFLPMQMPVLSKEQISDLGYTLTGDEPLKITILAKEYGYEGTELQSELEAQGIICEFADSDFLVLMLSPKNTDAELGKILNGLKNIPKKASVSTLPPPTFKSEAKMSPRDALLSPSEELPTDECEGHIFASSALSCPPAVPILVSGEVITSEAIEAFKYYGINKIRVVKGSK